MTHTPTPWKSIGHFIGTDEEDYQTIAYTDNHRNRKFRSSAQMDEDAAFIVHCVNYHDELVTMLQEITDRYARADKILVEDYAEVHNDYIDPGSNGTIERARKLLKEVS